MHIVHVVRQFHPSIGGLESVVWELASAQRRHGHDVRVVTLDRAFDPGQTRKLPARESLDGLQVVRIPFIGSKRYPLAPGVLKHIKRADIVHVHGLDFFFDFLAATAAIHRRTLVASTHGGFFHTPYAAALKRIYFSTITRLSFSRYAGVATVSVADDRLFRKIRSRGVRMIENGANVTKYANVGAPHPSKTIVTIGRFSANKRLDRLAAFMAALRRRDPAWRLKIVGRPWDLSVADVTALAAQHGVDDAVDIHNAPSDGEIRAILAKCSTIVSASEYEGFGLTAVEGMSAGLYPVLSDIPPFRHLIETLDLGLLVDFEDLESAAGRFLDQWNRHVVPNYDRLRQSAIDAAARYGWSRVSESYQSFYNSVRGTNDRAILDVAIRVATFREAVALLDAHAERKQPAVVTFANAHTLNMLHTNARANDVAMRSIVFNDGVGVDLASWLLFGKRFPANLNGTDFVPRYLRETRHCYRVFLLGAKPGVAARAGRRLAALCPQHRIVGTCHGYFSRDQADVVTDEVRRSHADVLLVAMGNLDQELWLTDHLSRTGCFLGLGVGALFDFLAGAVPRAPAWVRAVHLEWLYRLLREPSRMWRRYLVGMPVFLLRVTVQWLGGGRVTRAARR